MFTARLSLEIVPVVPLVNEPEPAPLTKLTPLKPPETVPSLLMVVSALVSVQVFVALTDLDYFRCGESFVQYMTGATGLVLLVIGPGVLLAGVVLPLIWRVAGSVDGDAGRVVGQLTSANTIAAAAGAMAASFVCLLYTSPSPRDGLLSRMPSSA